MTEKKRQNTRLPDGGANRISGEDYFDIDSSLPALEAESIAPPETAAAPKKQPEKSSKKPPKKVNPFLRGVKIFFITVFVLLLLLFGGATYGGYYVSGLNTTLPNLYIDGVFVGKMTEEEVISTLRARGWEERVNEELTVKLPHDIAFTVNYLRAGVRTPLDAAAELVCSYGRSGNWYTNLFNYIANLLEPVKLSTNSEIDEAYIRECISAAAQVLAEETADPSYSIDTERSIIAFVKGAGEMSLDEEALLEAIKEALSYDALQMSFSGLNGGCTSPDFQALFDKLAVKAQDAYYTEDFSVVDEVDGCWFDADDAQRIWDAADPLDKVEIPITLSYPEVTGEYLRSMLYRDKLGEGTTYFPRSVENRISNINLAASKVNGVILLPGETFSYNTCIGQRTEEAGFLRAGAYDNGKLVQEVGGGICQVSSTLYYASLFAGMETISRTSHYFMVDYMEIGMDATVSWPKPDFEFKNPLNYPVMLKAVCDTEEKSITVEIWGTREDYGYIEFRHQTYTRYDSEITDATIGYYVLGFRDFYDENGNLLKTVAEPPSDYFFQ